MVVQTVARQPYSARLFYAKDVPTRFVLIADMAKSPLYLLPKVSSFPCIILPNPFLTLR